MIDREKLRHRARLSTGFDGNTTLKLAYAGREVSEKMPLNPASLAAAIERMLDLLASHVQAEIGAVTVDESESA